MSETTSQTDEDVLEQIEEAYRLAHIINPPMNHHLWRDPSMCAQDILDIARERALPVKALCGYVFIPSKDPDKYPACEKCIEVAGALMRFKGE